MSINRILAALAIAGALLSVPYSASEASASPIGRSHPKTSGASASPIGRSHPKTSGASASPIGRSHPKTLSGQDAVKGKLATVKSIKCTFPLVAVGRWGGEQPEAKVNPAKLVLQFVEINADEGTARLEASVGAYDIIVRYSGGYLHFIQSFLDGPLYTTTILEKQTSGGKLKAMHSRHEYTDVTLPGFTSSPEQYYGECEILK